MLMRRRGAPLVRAAATTAVVAGTAGAVRHRQDQRWANQQADAAAAQQADADAQQAAYEQGVMAAQQAAAQQAAAQQAAQASAAQGGGIDMAQLKQLGDLHNAGVLNDEEFAAAKAKLLG